MKYIVNLYFQICSLLRGGIAERGGVRVGHRIIEINSQSVVAVPHEKIVNMLASAVGEVSEPSDDCGYSYRFLKSRTLDLVEIRYSNMQEIEFRCRILCGGVNFLWNGYHLSNSWSLDWSCSTVAGRGTLSYLIRTLHG